MTIDLLWLARWVLGPRLVVGGPAPDGRIEVEVRGQDLRALAGELAGFGAGIEVTGPDDLRVLLADIGRQLVALYP